MLRTPQPCISVSENKHPHLLVDFTQVTVATHKSDYQEAVDCITKIQSTLLCGIVK